MSLGIIGRYCLFFYAAISLFTVSNAEITFRASRYGQQDQAVAGNNLSTDFCLVQVLHHSGGPFKVQTLLVSLLNKQDIGVDVCLR